MNAGWAMCSSNRMRDNVRQIRQMIAAVTGFIIESPDLSIFRK